MALRDISIPIEPGMIVYDGNPGVEIELDSAIAAGAVANVSRVSLGAHTGSHVDGPSHFYDDGAGADSLPLESMVGPATVVELAAGEAGAIGAAALEEAGVPDGVERLLLKTSNSSLWGRDEFTRDFVRLDGSGAEWVLDRGLRLIGIDYLSIGDRDAHRALLGAGVVALEGLDLRAVEPGEYELLCLPLRLIGTDGAPARVIRREPGRAG